MNTYIEFFNFFTLGFFGGIGHCISMCHPFVIYTSSRFSTKKGYSGIIIPQLQYNAGRIVTYIMISIIISYIGDIINAASSLMGIQKGASILAGILLFLYGSSILMKRNIFAPIESRIASYTPKIMSKLNPKNPFMLGIFLGFLPCGLLYGALISAFGLSSASKSVVAILFFGIGTSIPLLIFSLIGSFLQKRYDLFNKISALVMISMGLYFIFGGIRY